MMNFGNKFSLIIAVTAAVLLQSCNSSKKSTGSNTKDVYTVAFYNVENLFDYTDNPKGFDEDYLPDGKYKWTSEKLKIKLSNLAKVISGVGDSDGPEVLGLAEVENRDVLEMLVSQEGLANAGYQIVHFESPDPRGIDCALLYKKGEFELVSSEKLTVKLKDPEDPVTRDILYVKGTIRSEDTLHLLVNHWPSRRGGRKETEPKRLQAASVARKKVDNILAEDPLAKVVVMGDFNDDHFNTSLKERLDARTEPSSDPATLFNPIGNLHDRDTCGTLMFRQKWNLFDMMMLSSGLVNSQNGLSYKMGSGNIYHPEWMQQPEGNYKDAPERSFLFGKFRPFGYSDHFPVYIHLQLK